LEQYIGHKPPILGVPMPSKLKQILAKREPAIGTWIGCSDPYLVEMIGDLGFDWFVIDMEHFPLSTESLRTILMACKGSQSALVVRVPVNSRNHIQAALDLGAQGVMVPFVNSRTDAEQAVEFTRYPPLGRRGFGPVRAGGYARNEQAYREAANEDISLFVQIETPEAVENAKDLLQVKGIDGVFIGNGDLANFMNDGKVGSSAVEKVVDDLISLITSKSLPVGLPTWSPDEFNRYARKGAHLLTIGSDMRFAASAARTELTEIREILKDHAGSHR
jgi:2-keto-3-deoxy-L-rhamnonate aldolase RhmA